MSIRFENSIMDLVTRHMLRLLDLGWVIVGELCMGGVHKSETTNVFRTNILQNGRTSFFPSCSKGIQVKEQFGTPIRQYQSTLPCYPVTSSCTDPLGDNVFRCLLKMASSLIL